MPEPAAESQAGTPSTLRLVVRVKIVPEGTPPAPVRQRSGKSALLLILGAVAVLLSWVGITMFRADPTPAPTATEGASTSESQLPAPESAPSEAAPASSEALLPKPAIETQHPPASPSSINEVIPDVPRSARETIRGTIRVSVRVIVDKDGTVLLATADDPGPSRYFERLAIEASRKWTFTPADSPEQRVMLVRFNFTRAGTTARASSLQ